MNTTNIKAFGIVLKPLKEEYLSFLVNWRNDPRVLVNMDGRREVNIKVMQTWFNIIHNKQDTVAYVAFLNNNPFAYVAFSKIGLKENIIEIVPFNSLTLNTKESNPVADTSVTARNALITLDRDNAMINKDMEVNVPDVGANTGEYD